jgi:hypothetical protein
VCVCVCVHANLGSLASSTVPKHKQIRKQGIRQAALLLWHSLKKTRVYSQNLRSSECLYPQFPSFKIVLDASKSRLMESWQVSYFFPMAVYKNLGPLVVPEEPTAPIFTWLSHSESVFSNFSYGQSQFLDAHYICHRILCVKKSLFP